MREIAIINTGKKIDIENNILKFVKDEGNITIFTPKLPESNDDGMKYVEIPSEILSSKSKVKNFVYSYYFLEKYTGFLHVIEDCIQVYNSPTSFICEIEKMIDMFSLKSWYNTVCDVCNYTFKIYNPRISIDLDSSDVKEKYNKVIYFTSHANTAWTCYNYGEAAYDDIKLDERFGIPMYYIIEFLARRRNTKKDNELYFMNYYPTVAEEKNVFRLLDEYEEDEIKEEQYKAEGELFNSMKINHDSDMAVEPIMESLHFLLTR